MNHFRIFLALILLLSTFRARAQGLDSVQQDLEKLNDLEFFKKYSLYENTPSTEDIKVIKLIWSLHHPRKVDLLIRQKGIKTVTLIENRPTIESPYYIVGHYQLHSATEHLFRMSYYRVNKFTEIVEYQKFTDFIKDKWKKVN